MYPEHCDYSYNFSGSFYGGGYSGSCAQESDQEMILETGGKGKPQQNLWRIGVSAIKYTDPSSQWQGWNGTPEFLFLSQTNVDSGSITVDGKALGNDGNLYEAISDGATRTVTPSVSGADDFVFGVTTQECILEVPSLAPDQGLLVATNSNIYLVSYCEGSYVTVVGTPCCSTDQRALAQYWKMDGVLPYTNEDGTVNPTKRLVDRSQIGSQTITATAGGLSTSIKIIVYHAWIQLNADAGDCELNQHAWWDLEVEPSDVKAFLTGIDPDTGAQIDLSGWLGEVGYYGDDSDSCLEGCPGHTSQPGPQPITGSTPQQYYSPTGLYWSCISFNNLKSALQYVNNLNKHPGTYSVLSNSCVTQAEIVGGAAGVNTGYGGITACLFSAWLQAMYANTPPVCGCND